MIYRSMIARLITKDLYLNRWFIIGGTVAGLLCLAVAGTSSTGFTIGGVAFMTTLIGLGIFLCIYNVVQEREKGSLLFILSLPVSLRQHAYAKLVASLISFLVPWGIALIASLIAIRLLPEVPDGFMPFLIVLMLLFLCNFSMLLGISLTTKHEVWVVGAIIVTNMSISLVMNFVSSIPVFGDYMNSEQVIWSREFLALMAFGISLIVLVLGLTCLKLSRKKNFL